MTAEQTKSEQEHEGRQVLVKNNGSGSVYGLGLIGAWVYYFKRATTTEERIKAFFKGLVWPAFLVYELLAFLKKE